MGHTKRLICHKKGSQEVISRRDSVELSLNLTLWLIVKLHSDEMFK
jgi:hypothetical protein